MHACLPLRLTWADPNSRSKHFSCLEDHRTIELNRYIWIPSKPQIGITYRFLDTTITIENACFKFPDEWVVYTDVVDLSDSPLLNDSDLYEHLMTYMFEQGWELRYSEWATDLEREMKRHPRYWDRSREFLKKRISFIKLCRDYSFPIWNYWKEKSSNLELRRAISDAHLSWNMMPEAEKEKLPEEYRKLYRQLVSKKK